MSEKVTIPELIKLIEKPTKPPKPPKGYTEKRGKAWNWGFVFYWSPFYKKWINKNQTVTVRPTETIEEAKKREKIDPECKVFFPL